MTAITTDDPGAQLRRVEFVGPRSDRSSPRTALSPSHHGAGIVAYLRYGSSGSSASRRSSRTCTTSYHSRVLRVLPVGVLAAGARGDPRDPGLLGERVVVVPTDPRELPQDAKAPVNEIIDNAITRTMSRTIITHGSTQIMVLSMLVFGGPALHYFAVALTIGILFGIYSSVLVMAPLVAGSE